MRETMIVFHHGSLFLFWDLPTFCPDQFFLTVCNSKIYCVPHVMLLYCVQVVA